jgi:hypothetical protein
MTDADLRTDNGFHSFNFNNLMCGVGGHDCEDSYYYHETQGGNESSLI